MTPAATAHRAGARRWLALVTATVVLAGSVGSAGAEATLHGRLVASDGLGAAGYAIRLIGPDGTGTEVRTDLDGSYRFDALPVGRHTIVIVDPAGSGFPVEVPTLQLADRTRTRADFKLLDANPTERNRPGGIVGSARSWWSDLTTPAKVWTALVIVSAGLLVAAGLDDGEQPATPF